MSVLSVVSTEGERFAHAIAAQDRAALRAVLADDVDFAALTPSRPWTATNPAEVVDDIVLGRWFGPDRRIVELSSVTTAEVADCRHVGYRLLVQRDGADHVVEQHAFYTARDGRIDWIRIVCSGYRASSPPQRQFD
jgi:ketosteroid isomerase-like protein